jgi:DNA-binding LytR/AlgR family response regulator
LNYFNLSYFINLDGSSLEFDSFLIKLALPTIFFTTIPLIIFTLLLFNSLTEKENEKLSKQTQMAGSEFENQALENSLAEDKKLAINDSEGTPQYEAVLEPIIYSFGDTNNKKVFKIASENFYYITSAQNYIEIFYRNKEEKLSRLVVRNSLKAIEEEMNLDMNSALIRCHKAFIINREKVVDFGGTLKSGYFTLLDIEESIPISRNKFADLEQQFQFILDKKMEIGVPV